MPTLHLVFKSVFGIILKLSTSNKGNKLSYQD